MSMHAKTQESLDGSLLNFVLNSFMEPYEIKDHTQEYQNTPLQNINQTSTYIWGRDMGSI